MVYQRTIIDSYEHREFTDEMHDLWADRELGNDFYYTNIDVDDEDDQKRYPKLCQFIKDNNIEDTHLIHFWW